MFVGKMTSVAVAGFLSHGLFQSTVALPGRHVGSTRHVCCIRNVYRTKQKARDTVCNAFLRNGGQYTTASIERRRMVLTGAMSIRTQVWIIRRHCRHTELGLLGRTNERQTGQRACEVCRSAINQPRGSPRSRAGPGGAGTGGMNDTPRGLQLASCQMA